jgi:hypothetical protein
MKTFLLFLQRTLAFTVFKTNAFPRTYAAVILALLSVSGLPSCHRASQAYFAPTSHPAAQRAAIPASPVTPSTDPQISASRSDVPTLATTPVWEQTTLPTLEPAVVATASQPARRQQPKRILRNKPLPPQCDQIVLRNGDVIEAKIKEVGVNEIKYKKCDRPDGPDYTISKRDVLSIKYSTGDVERFNAASAPSSSNSGGNRSSYDSPTNAQNDGPRTDPFAIVAIATGALAVLTGYGAFLLGAAAIVFGAVSLSRIRKEPGRFKGKGLAIGGMVAGLVSAGLILLYILL